MSTKKGAQTSSGEEVHRKVTSELGLEQEVAGEKQSAC